MSNIPKDFQDTFLDRSTSLLTEEGIRHLARCKVLIAGCGGVGGGMALTLCRMGVGEFHLADPADFDPPDMNRQFAALGSTMGRNKAEVYKDLLLEINPNCKVKTFSEGLTDKNHDEFLGGGDVLVDCLDAAVPYELRETMHQKARAEHIFACVGPILGFGCFTVCSSPDGMDMQFWTNTFKSAKSNQALPKHFYDFFTPSHLDVIGQSLQIGRVPTLAVGPMIATSLLATEAIAYLLEPVVPGTRPPVVLPNVMFFDLMKMSYKIVDIRDLQS